MRERLIRYIVRIALDEMRKYPGEVHVHIEGRTLFESIRKHQRNRGIGGAA